jgi:hypothetical protein
MTRLRQALQPDWVHTLAARRSAAGALVVLAAIAALRADPHGDQSPAVVAARDLTPGAAVTMADIRLENRLTATLPDGTQSDTDPVVGAIIAGPVRRGEVITDARLLGPRLAQSAAGPDARIVPLHLADSAVSDLVRAGDVVDILAAPVSEADAAPRVIATDAIVVSVSAGSKTPTAAAEPVVLVALPVRAAHTVAGATLVQTVTLTIH